MSEPNYMYGRIIEGADDRGDWLLEQQRDKRLAERDAEIAWLKKTLAIPPGYRLQPISEFDAMESARIETDALRAENARLVKRVADLEHLVVALAEDAEREPDGT